MQLTSEQELLARDGTPAEKTAMELLVGLGELYDAERLVPITGAHVSGASYKTVGDAGVAFLEEFAASARVRVRTTVNPAGMVLLRARALDLPKEFVEPQERIVAAYRRMGVEESWTCTPYLAGHRPGFGDHIAWAETSAACFANAVLGARTNRESGVSALAAAVVGATPDFGLHREDNRRATVLVDVQTKVEGAGFALLGLAVGERLVEGVPCFRGIRGTEDDWKALAAALASAGNITMFHVEGSTPEAKGALASDAERLAVDSTMLAEEAKRRTTAADADLIVVGCPHLSPDELRRVAELVERHRPTKPVWAFTSRAVADQAPAAVEAIEARGGRVLVDTDAEVMDLERFCAAAATPSGKAAVYLPTLCHQRVLVDDLEALVRRFA